MLRQLAIILALTLLTGPTTGCFVLEELSAGQKEMERYSKGRKAREAAEAAAAAELEGETAERSIHAYEDKLGEWWGWSGAHSLDTEDLDESIVRCQLGGSSQFMARDDCLARGGKPSDASG